MLGTTTSSAPGRALGLAVPLPGPGVCATCRGPARDGRLVCWCCRTVGKALGCDDAPDPRVVPVALCRPGDPLHRVLRGYKDAPGRAARADFAARLARHLRTFVGAHGPCLADATGAWDAVATVPSSSRRQGRVPVAHPLDIVIDAVPGAVPTAAPGGGPTRVRLERVAGSASPPIGHLAPDAAAFTVTAASSAARRARRVLVVDDAWVTGARLRSAAATLEAAGFHVVAMVVAGRIVDTGAVPAVARWWSWAQRQAAASTGSSTPRCRPGCRAAT